MCLGCEIRKRRRAADDVTRAEVETGTGVRWKSGSLVKYELLPEWMKDNDCIHAAYRPPMPNVRECFTTGLFGMHNESVNIWSHLLALVAFLALCLYLVTHLTSVQGEFAHHLHHLVTNENPHVPHTEAQSLQNSEKTLATWLRTQPLGVRTIRPPHVSPDDIRAAFSALLREHRVAMLPMLIAACFCFAASTAYHILWNHSPRIMRIFSRLDYGGIIVLTAGHSCMASFYLFYCRPGLAFWYNAALAIVSVPTVALFFHPRFEFPEFRTIRAVLFVTFGILGGLPLAHAGVLHAIQPDLFFHHLLYLGLTGILYLLGAVIFATRVPEKFWPGQFDLFFSSHQWLHFAVIAAALVHWFGCVLEMRFRLDHGCSFSPL